MNQYRYVELIKDNPSYRGKIVELPEGVHNYDLDYFGKEVVNGFHSVFMHLADFYRYAQSTGSIRSYSGNVYSEFLYWDMDNDNLEQAKQDTEELVERLLIYSKDIRIYFSGNKGFHIFLFSPELEKYKDHSDFNNIVRNVCSNIALKLVSFDSKIYDKTRIIRTPNSIHPETKLYKIEITYDELKKFTTKEIQELAKSQRKIEFNYNRTENPELLKLIDEASKVKQQSKIGGLFNAQELLDGIAYGFECGRRNTAFASIAGMLRARNVDEDFIRAILYGINKNNEEPLSEVEVDHIVQSISKYPVKEEYNIPKDEDIVDIREAGKEWKRIIKSSGYTSFGERFNHINQRMKLCIPGDAIAFIASSGVGKTTIGLELSNNEAKVQDTIGLIASLEMSRGGIFFRAATIEATELSQDDYVPSSDVAKELLDQQTLEDKVYENWKSIRIIDKGGLSLDQIVEYFYIAQDTFGKPISNLTIDYGQNLRNAEDVTYAMSMARQFKQIAKSLKTKLIVLLQTNKAYNDDYNEIFKNNVEGVGAYFHTMDYVIAAWKSRDYKNRLHAKFLKDRWGESDYRFDFVREGLKYHTDNYVPDRPPPESIEDLRL